MTGMVTRNYCLLIFLFLFCIAGCNSNQNTNGNNNGSDQNGDMLRVDYSTQGSLLISGNNNDTFIISNSGDQCIEFPFDWGLKIAAKNHNDWIDIRNLAIYQSKEDLFLGSKDTLSSKKYVSFIPAWKETSLKSGTPIKITIRGFLCNNKKAVIEKTIFFHFNNS